MIKRYFIHLSYKGTLYHGWQSQPNSTTVQHLLENALTKLLKRKIKITGAGRTDTGVHALNYYAHFDLPDFDIAFDDIFLYHLNCILPNDIAVYKIFQVESSAHARFDPISRTYTYHINQIKNPFVQDSAYYFSRILDVDLMNEAASVLKEFDDFTSFSKLHTDNKTNNCKIFMAHWSFQNNELVFTITADRFLRNMVRSIVGTLIDVGLKKISVDQFRALIKLKNRSLAGMSVPAHGLFLTEIKYSYIE